MTGMRGLAHVVVVLLLAACGRIGFDSTGTSNGPVSVVQTQSVLTLPPSKALATLSPTLAGDLIVVATSNIDFINQPLVSITDNVGDTFVSANCSYIGGMTTGEIWYAITQGGAVQITIVDSPIVRREIWVLEVANATQLVGAGAVSNSTGVPLSPIDAGPTAPADASSDLVEIAPKVTPSRVPAVVFSILNTGAEEGVEGSFIPLSALNDDDAAYQVVEAPGSYAATWLVSNDNNQFGAATAAFAPP